MQKPYPEGVPLLVGDGKSAEIDPVEAVEQEPILCLFFLIFSRFRIPGNSADGFSSLGWLIVNFWGLTERPIVPKADDVSEVSSLGA